MSKIAISRNIDMFLCPVCGEKMTADGLTAIACSKKHSFDISKKGYVNLLLNQRKTEYGKGLLESRNIICKSGFFKPMTDMICSLIAQKFDFPYPNTLKLLDAGCGEGSHLSQITSGLSESTLSGISGFGIDISKYGIHIASKKHPDHVWCVADLSRLPFAAGKFDIILSILSPSNYGEFNRVLKDGGVLLKVIPGGDYLKELRKYLYDSTPKETYSNKRVIEHFRSNFNILHIEQLQYSKPVCSESIEHLINMTPLSWGAAAENKQDLLHSGMDSVTMNFSIVMGKKKKSN